MSVNIVQISNYNDNVLPLFLEQYKSSVNLVGIVGGSGDQANDIEVALFEIRDYFWLDTAEGVQLNTIGSIFVVERDGRSDTDYRAAIREKTSLKFSGEPESIISILKSVYGATFVYYDPGEPAFPASYFLITDAIVTVAQLEVISPAGVQPYLGDFLVDALGNHIQDALGNDIIAGTII